MPADCSAVMCRNISCERFLGGKVWPDIGAPLAARLTGEQRLYIGQPDVIGPSVRAHGRRVAASIVGAIDQEAANAGGSRFSKSDFLLAHHRPMQFQPPPTGLTPSHDGKPSV